MKTILASIGLLSAFEKVSSIQSPTTFFGDNNNNNNNEAYLHWTTTRGQNYDHAIFLESAAIPQQGTAIHWSIINQTSSINLAVAARAEGWVGFGLSENGGMRGADIVIFKADEPNKLVDAHVMQELYPVEDACQSWELLYSQTHDGFIIFEATRLLDSRDTQDRKIINDSDRLVEATLLISAWGDTPDWGYHGTNFGKGAIRLFGDGSDEYEAFRTQMEAEAEGSFFVGADNFLIPNVETTYQQFCIDAKALESQGVPLNESLHIIGVEPIVDNKTTKLVHHFTSSTSPNVQRNQNGECFISVGESLYGWAPGALPFHPPDYLGLPFGSTEEGVQSVEVTVHYNNPWFESGHIDSSGIRVYWTSKERKYEIGAIPLADPATRLNGTLVGQGGLSKHTFTCPSSCTQAGFSGVTEPITVIQEGFHMHKTGVRAITNVIRDGEVFHTASVDFFDYDQLGQMYAQQQPYQLVPGDAFSTTFYYDAPDPNQAFGYSSQEEMSIATVRYFPRQTVTGRKLPPLCLYGFPVPNCGVQHSSEILSVGNSLGRSFGSPGSTDGGAVCVADSSKNVHYDPTIDEAETPISGSPSALYKSAGTMLVAVTVGLLTI